MKNIFFSILVVLILISCSTEELSFFNPSDDFIESNVNVSVIDTITFKLSTYKFDSIATDVGGDILVGKYTDPVFGIVKSSGFVDYVPKDYDIDENAVFDSIVLNLPYSGYFYNDTLLQKKIRVEELSKIIRFRNDQTRFYNTTDVPTSNLIGERTFYPRIKAKDSINITLSYNFGLNLFNKIRDGVIVNSEDLKLNFKGIKISPDETENASIIGFKGSSSYIRFYYSLPDNPGIAEAYDFVYNSVDGESKYFSQISSDRTGTVFPNFTNNEVEFFPTSSMPYTYINSGVGIVTKIVFPHFNESISNLNQSGIIYKANLKIPLRGSNYSDKLFTSDSVQVFIVDQNNEIVTTLYDGNKQAVGRINKEEPDINEKYIEIPVANFLETTLSTPLYRNYGLILVPYGFNSSTTRTILNTQNNSQKKAKLIITYLNYGN